MSIHSTTSVDLLTSLLQFTTSMYRDPCRFAQAPQSQATRRSQYRSQVTTMQPTTVPAVYMRGGTSKALFFHDKDIPPHGPHRDRFLMRVMGSPDPMQIDGMGGTYPVTSKIAVIRPSERDDADVDFLFAQVSVKEKFVDWAAGCGNISSGVGPFAINEGLIEERRTGNAAEGYTTQEVRIYQSLSTKKVLVAHVPIDESTGRFIEKGDYKIAGCPGAGSPILMDYRYVHRLPTTHRIT